MSQVSGIANAVAYGPNVKVGGFPARGYLYGLSLPSQCGTGNTWVIDDGVNPPTTFEYDRKSVPTVVVTDYHRLVALPAALTTREEHRDVLLAALQGAPKLNIEAEDDPGAAYPSIILTNKNAGSAGNVAIVKNGNLGTAYGMDGGLDLDNADGSVAYGNDISIAGIENAVFGSGVEVPGNYNVVMGNDIAVVFPKTALTSFMDEAVVIGHGISVDGADLGSRSVFVGKDISVGNYCTESVALGYGIVVDYNSNSVLIGANVDCSGFSNTLAIGDGASGGYDNVTIGPNSPSGYYGGVTIGSAANNQGSSSVAIGEDIDLSSSADYSVGIGASVVMEGSDSVCIGESNQVYEDNVVAIGHDIVVESGSDYMVVIGDSIYPADDTYDSVFIGDSISDYGDSCYSVAIGPYCEINTEEAVILGDSASGYGYQGPVAIGYYAICGGYNGVALGTDSYIGTDSDFSMALGEGAYVEDGIEYGAAIGSGTEVIANYAYAIGANAVAGYENSFAFGRNAFTEEDNQAVFGNGTRKINVFIHGEFGCNGRATAGLQPQITDPTGGGVVDAEARTAIASLIDAMEVFGFLDDGTGGGGD
jgi:hypothetical protein